jgi:hypothetical protein
MASTLDNDERQRRMGIIEEAPMTLDFEQGIDEKTGMPYTKQVLRSTTPTEQKAIFEKQKAKMDLQREVGKRSLLAGYIKGELQEGAVIESMKEFDITPDEFDQATTARERMKQISQQQTFSGQPVNIPGGQPIPNAQPQPIPSQEQSFRFKQTPMSEIKVQKEMEAADVAEKKQAEFIQSGARDMLNTIAEVKKGVNNFGAMGGVPSTPWDYDRKNWESNVDKLLSKRVIDLMNEMKQASKTGATGMGALSEKELAVLQNASTALKRSIGPEQAKKILEDMEQSLNKVISGQPQGGQPSSQGDVRSQYNALRASGVSAEQAKAQLGL